MVVAVAKHSLGARTPDKGLDNSNLRGSHRADGHRKKFDIGNAVLQQEAPTTAKATAITFESDSAHPANDTGIVLEGNVRLEYGGYVFTTNRATIANNGTIQMAMAYGFKALKKD